eukprot:TRINITY_DN24833_c0_g1_i1.p1 TRINITY_DN24833_c0_g1~~TRINITY_DN24833_c0_g1_i1.p1  ORF type:complete len:371 (+),score=70.58 TRINITY_DN24833_c0_g1_i1:90-1202(+)
MRLPFDLTQGTATAVSAGDTNPYHALAFSATGGALYAAGGRCAPDGAVLCCVLPRGSRRPTRTEVLRLQPARAGADTSAAVSGVSRLASLHNGTLMVASSNGWDHCVRQASIRSGAAELSAEAYGGHRGDITCLSATPPTAPAGQLCFLTASLDRFVRVWRVGQTRFPLHQLGPLPRTEAGAAPLCATDATGLVVAAAASADMVFLWDRRLGGECFAALQTSLPPAPVASLEWDGAAGCVVSSADGGISLVHTDADEGAATVIVPSGGGSEGLVGAACLSPCGTHVVRGSRSGAVHCYPLAQDYGAAPQVLAARASDSARHSGPLLCAGASPADWHLATAADCGLLLWTWPWRGAPGTEAPRKRQRIETL